MPLPVETLTNFKEIVTLTLLPSTEKGMLIQLTAKNRKQCEERATKLWAILGYSHYRKDANEQNIWSYTQDKWRWYHPDLLLFSCDQPTFVYQLDVEHPSTGLKFRRFYHDGKAQFCETITETYNHKSLL